MISESRTKEESVLLEADLAKENELLKKTLAIEKRVQSLDIDLEKEEMQFETELAEYFASQAPSFEMQQKAKLEKAHSEKIDLFESGLKTPVQSKKDKLEEVKNMKPQSKFLLG